MKKVLFTLVLGVVISSCSTYNSIDSFYNQHKDDDQVMAIRVPRVMLSLVSSISPELDAMVGNTRDLRYMQFPSKTDTRTQYLNKQMNTITGNAFIEVFRRNDQLKRNVVSIREKGNAVREILVYKNDNLTGSILYFNGEFDPIKVKEMADAGKFENISDGLIKKFNLKTPGINE